MNVTSVQDVQDVAALVREAIDLKKDPLAFRNLGRDKTLGLVFMNPSLRTRLSTQKAASNLGMNVMAVNADRDSWAIEFQDGAVMNGTTVEHIRDAAPVLGSYCDIMGIRCFPGLVSRDTDYSEHIMKQFIKWTGRPCLSLESATLHPLQSLADCITIAENRPAYRPKVVLASSAVGEWDAIVDISARKVSPSDKIAIVQGGGMDSDQAVLRSEGFWVGRGRGFEAKVVIGGVFTKDPASVGTHKKKSSSLASKLACE